MKKVGKEFKKTLSAILVAAMVFTSLPQTTLVANAAEEDQQYDVGDYGEVGATDSQTVENVKFNVQDVSGLTVEADVTYDKDTKLVCVTNAKVSPEYYDYEIASIGGQPISNVDDFEAYRIENREAAPESLDVVVKAKGYNLTAPSSVDGAKSVEYYVGEEKITNLNSLKAGTVVKAVVTVEETESDSVTVSWKIGEGSAKDITGSRTPASEEEANNEFTYEFTVTVTKNLSISIDVTKDSLKDVNFVVPDSITTIKYTNDAEVDIADYKTVTLTEENKKVSLVSGKDYYFIFDTSKTIKVETGTETKTPVYPTSVTAGTAYKVNVGATGETITVTEVENESTVAVDADDNVKAVYYTTDSKVVAEDYTFAKADFAKADTSIKVEKDVKVYVYVEYKDNFEKKSVKINDKDATSTTAGVYTVATKDVGSPAIVIESQQSVYEYTIDAASSHAKIVIAGDNVKAVNGKDVESTDPIEIATKGIKIDGTAVDEKLPTSVTLKVLAGETLSFEVTPADGYKNPVATTANGKTISYSNEKFSFKTNNTNKGAITVTTTEFATNSITFAADDTAETPDGKQIASQVKSVTVLGETEKDNVEVLDKAHAAEEKSEVSFEVEAKAGYEVKKVEYIYTPEGGTEIVELTASNGVYTIESVPAVNSSSVKIYTQIKAEDANKATFTFSDDAEVTLTINEAYKFENAYPVKSGTAVVTTSDKVSYTIKAKDGYEITKIDGKEITKATSKTGTISFTAENKEAAVSVEVAPKANEKDKFIKIAESNNYTLTLSDVEAVETDKEAKTTTYKIAQDKAEVAFTITVPYGKKVEDIKIGDASIVGKAANIDLKSGVTSGKTVTYKGKLVTYLLTAVTAEKASEITIVVDNEDAKVFVDGMAGLAAYSIDDEFTIIEDNKGFNIKLGSTVILEVAKDYKLYTVDKAGKNPKEVKLDIYNKYKFTVDKDIYFKIAKDEVKEADYKVSASYVETDANGEKETNQLENVSGTNTFVTPNDAGKVTVTLVDKENHELTIKEVASSSKDTTATKGDGKVEVAISKTDANKKVTVKLTVEDKSETTGVVKTVEVPVVFDIEAALTGIVVKGIEKGGSITLDPLTETEFKASVAPETFKTNGNAIKDLVDVKVAVEKGTAATKAVFDGNDNLVITTGLKAETATITVTEKGNSKNVLFTATVVTAVPTYNLAKAESTAQSSNYVNITLTPDKKAKIAKDSVRTGNKIFYEVVVNSKDATAPAGSLSNKAYYFAADTDADGNILPVAASIAVNTAKTDAAAGTYELKARIVIVDANVTDVTTDGVVATTKAVTPVADTAIVSAGKAITIKTATKNAYYEDKLSLTKKTTKLYNNGDEQTVAVVKYSKNASYIDDVYPAVFNADGTYADMYDFEATGVDGFAGYVDKQTGEVIVKVLGDVAPGKYDVVVYAEGVKNGDVDTMYRATAKVTINVQQAITGIYADNVKLLANGKKDLTYTFKPSTNWYDRAAKTNKFTYELKPTSLNDNAKKNVTIDAKGKLTIKKGFVVGNDPEDNKFDVIINAADFANNTKSTTVTVEVTNQKTEISEVYLGEYNDVTGKYDKLPTTITLSQAYYASVVAIDADGKQIDWDYYSTKATNNSWQIKPSKTLQFTATALDGGKSSKKSDKYTVTYDNSDNLKMEFYNADDNSSNAGGYNRLVATGENTYEYYGTVNPKFYFGMKDGNIDARNWKYGYTISVKGGKLLDFNKVTFKNNVVYGDYNGYIMPTDKVTTITITKANKQKITVTLTNKNFQTTKAPSAKLVKGKLYTGINDYQSLRYKVTGDYDAAYVTYESGIYSVYDGTAYINDGEFTLYSDSFLTAGAGKYSVVYGDFDDNDNFIPKTKAASLSIKVNKLANYKPQTSYTLNLKDSKYIELTGKPVEMKDIVGYWDLRNANIKGQPNKFLEYFAQVKDENGNDTNQLVATDKLVKDVAAGTVDKNNLIGYVKYSYEVRNSVWVDKDVKITIKIDAKDKKYATTGFTILNKVGAYGYSEVTLNKAYVTLGKVAAVDSANWTAEIVKYDDVDENQNPIKVNSNTIKLTAKTAPAAGKQKVKVAILPENSQYTDAAKDGVIVEIPVTVSDAAASKGKVVVKNTKIDLSKAAVPGYDTKVKTGTWTVCIYAGYDYKYAIEGIELKTAEVKDVTGVSAKYVKATNTVAAHIEITVNKNDVKLGKTITVPVELTFADGSAAEEIKLQVVVPKKVADMASVKAEIEKYLTGIDKNEAQGDITDEIDTIVAKNVIAGVTASTAYAEVTVEEATKDKPAVKSTKVTVTLTDRADSKVTEKIEVTLAQPSDATSEQTAEEAYTELAKKAALLVKTKGETEEDKDKVVVTNDTTRFAVRELLSPAITNDKFMLSIVKFDKTKATTKADGSITIRYRLVDKNGVINTPDDNEYVEVVKTIAKLTEEAK